jgi:hypothetical protein
MEVMCYTGIQSLPQILSIVEDDNQLGAFAIAQVNHVTVAYTVK